jgi:hypothetical protein
MRKSENRGQMVVIADFGLGISEFKTVSGYLNFARE